MEFVTVYTDDNGRRVEQPMTMGSAPVGTASATGGRTVQTIELDGDL